MQFIIGNVAFKLILRFKLRYEILKKNNLWCPQNYISLNLNLNGSVSYFFHFLCKIPSKTRVFMLTLFGINSGMKQNEWLAQEYHL